MLKKLLALMLVLFLTLSLTLAGCNNEDTPDTIDTPSDTDTTENIDKEKPEEVEPKILSYGTNSLDGKFNPIISDNVYDSYVVDIIFDGLITNNPSGEPIPDIATWEISEDKKTYIFNLEKGIKFHDGEELTAEDVEFTYYTIAHPDYTGPRGSVITDIVGAQAYRDGEAETIEGIKVIDDYTISFTIEEPNVQKIWDFSYGIMPKHIYEFSKYEDFLSLNQNPVGCGPFKFEKYEVGQYLETSKFDDYWKEPAKIDGVRVVLIPSETQPQAVGTGEVDLVQPTANLDNQETIESMGKASVQTFVGNGYNYIGFNLRLPKFQDKRVRQALTYGLNRKGFIDSQWEGFAKVCNAPISPVSWAFTEDINTYEFNPKKAKELLEEAGWIDRDDDGWVENEAGEELTITWTAYNDVDWPLNLIAVAKENWKEIGVQLEGDLMEFNAVSEKVYDNRDFEIYNMGWSLSIDPDPTGIWDKASDVPGGFNSIGFYNERAEELFKAGLTEYDQDARAEIYKEWAKIANEEMPYIFIAIREEMWGVSNRVKGLELGPYYDWSYQVTDIEIE